MREASLLLLVPCQGPEGHHQAGGRAAGEPVLEGFDALQERDHRPGATGAATTGSASAKTVFWDPSLGGIGEFTAQF